MSRPANFRDLGGIQGADGRKVKPCRLLRSGEPTGLSGEDKDRLTDEYNLKTIVDFRTQDEVDKSPDDTLPGAEYHHIDILENSQEQAPALEHILKMKDAREAIGFMGSVYETMVASPGAQRGYAQFIRMVLAQREGALLFHCFAGKDRTGVGAAIVLTLLGADRDAVVRDYMRTNEMHADLRQMTEKLESYGIPADKIDVVRAFMHTHEEYLERAFDTMNKLFGSFDGYAKEALGLTDADVASLRANYLTD